MKRKIFSILLALCMTFIVAPVNAANTPSDWAVDEVSAAQSVDLVTEKVTRDYQKNITREEFCELVMKLYEKLTNETVSEVQDNFIDTDNEEILKAYQLGIVQGVSDNEFAPNNSITRQEICVMLVRCIDVSIETANIHNFNNNDFADKNQIASWAIDFVNYAYDNGIIRGIGENRIDPLGNTTCEQAILLVYRVYTSQNEIDTVYELDLENIKTDSETDISYVDNIIIILFKDTADEEDKNDVVDAINGTVVGQFDTINQYQVQVKNSTLDELNELCDIVNNFDCVLYSTYDVAAQFSTDTITVPNDTWDNDDWNETSPSGNNWWLEVIQAPSAWNYNDQLENIKIGIVDSGFDTGHEDLKDKLYFAADYNENINDKADHGTHVAGIIGASADNNKGITGIVWDSELICFDWKPTTLQSWFGGWNTSTAIAAGLIETVKAGAKVINFSLGCSSSLANNNSTFSQEWIDAQAETASMYMASLLYQGYDFLVVQSAGNGASDGVGVDAVYNGWFSSVTSDNCYNGLNTADDVLDRIVIVGAAEQNNGSYIQAQFSNGGDQVNICAPGVNVYSTVTGGLFGDYAYMSGTSMAAPIVTGVSALVWSADNELTGKEVKDIVCDTNNTNISVPDNVNSPNAVGSYRMVNAKLSVEKALGMGYNDNELLADFSFENSLEDIANSNSVYGYGDYTFASGVNGNCLYLDGDGDYLDLGNDYHLTDDFTFNVWVKSENEDRSDAAIFAKYDTNGYGPYDFYMSYNRPAFWISNGAGGYDEFISDTTLSSDRWHMVTYVKDGSDYKIYIDGELDLSFECYDITTNDDTVTIGRQNFMFSPYSDLEYKGYIDELKIYNKAFTQEEINDLYDEFGPSLTDNQIYAEYQSHRYEFFNNCDSWEEAKAYCESLGGHLATISSQEENDYIYYLLTDAGYSSAYFGLTDSEEEGAWEWVNGEPVTYTNWHSSEPSNDNSNEDYAMFYWKYNDGTWNDGDFSGSTVGDKVFICEWD